MGGADAPKQTGGWAASASRTNNIKFYSDGRFDDEYFQQSEEWSQFRNEYEMRKMKQDQGLDMKSEHGCTCTFCLISTDPFSDLFRPICTAHTIRISYNPGDTKNALVTTHRTLDLTSSLDMTPTANQGSTDMSTCQTTRSVLTITFQFPFENSLAESVATMARQYVRSVINSVQRVAMAISPGLSPCVVPKTSPGSPEALTLAQWICQSYMYHLGADLLSAGSVVGESLLKDLWQHQDAILCCSLKVKEIFSYTRDKLTTEDVLILDCHTEIYVWVSHNSVVKSKQQALSIGL
ncbi:homeobox-leucine zipper protein REVOLUTA isoform X2 [Helianthus annuus]|uniref:homeobox-leucine zipper protein REVOLUTA isoform X2 n=1 Tax=Helianthus annuus TaxID=4232 RepID=UPI000B8EF070|nr:homeobox-leucine zipper protein REVOLUTA isoform X2 [Helianthus annuus]